jgi:hypothetical protein
MTADLANMSISLSLKLSAAYAEAPVGHQDPAATVPRAAAAVGHGLVSAGISASA